MGSKLTEKDRKRDAGETATTYVVGRRIQDQRKVGFAHDCFFVWLSDALV